MLVRQRGNKTDKQGTLGEGRARSKRGGFTRIRADEGPSREQVTSKGGIARRRPIPDKTEERRNRSGRCCLALHSVEGGSGGKRKGMDFLISAVRER